MDLKLTLESIKELDFSLFESAFIDLLDALLKIITLRVNTKQEMLLVATITMVCPTLA